MSIIIFGSQVWECYKLDIYVKISLLVGSIKILYVKCIHKIKKRLNHPVLCSIKGKYGLKWNWVQGQMPFI